MIQRQAFPRLVALMMIVVAASLLAGCAAKKAPEAFWGDPETGLILEYRMPDKAPLQYEMTTTFVQSMDMGGQTIDTQSTSMNLMSLSSSGTDGDEISLSVTIDDVSISVDAPGASIEPDMSDVIGKSFEMALSTLGEERNLPDPDLIQYDLGQGGKRSAISGVQMMFPDLPGRPIKIGESWTTIDGFTEKGGGGGMTISFESVNTLVGIETVSGMECVKIDGQYTGTIKGSGVEGPAQWESEGEIEGVSTWYFAYKEGILVSDATEGIGAANVVAQTPQGDMTIPTVQDISATTKLIK